MLGWVLWAIRLDRARPFLMAGPRPEMACIGWILAVYSMLIAI